MHHSSVSRYAGTNEKWRTLSFRGQMSARPTGRARSTMVSVHTKDGRLSEVNLSLSKRFTSHCTCKRWCHDVTQIYECEQPALHRYSFTAAATVKQQFARLWLSQRHPCPRGLHEDAGQWRTRLNRAARQNRHEMFLEDGVVR